MIALCQVAWSHKLTAVQMFWVQGQAVHNDLLQTQTLDGAVLYLVCIYFTQTTVSLN